MKEEKKLSLAQRLENIVSIDAYIKETAHCTIEEIFPKVEDMVRFMDTFESFLEKKIDGKTSYREVACGVHALFERNDAKKAGTLIGLLLENARPLDMSFEDYNHGLNAMFPGNEKTMLRNQDAAGYGEESLRVVLAKELKKLQECEECQLIKELFIDPYYDLVK